MTILFALVLFLIQAGGRTTMHATGPFDVKTTPQAVANPGQPGSFLLDKQYHGTLEATSVGQMLGGGDLKSGIAGYVAMETVTGILDGRVGSFQLMHWGQMQPGHFVLKVEVVPGSGTGDLKGISGTMTIANDQGKHSYALDYTLPD
jgi:hypothetical protein